MPEIPEAAYDAADRAFGSWHKNGSPGRDELDAALLAAEPILADHHAQLITAEREAAGRTWRKTPAKHRSKPSWHGAWMAGMGDAARLLVGGQLPIPAASRQPAAEEPARGLEGLGQRIRARRTELGLSQRDLMDRAGVNQPNLCYWERGRRRPSLEHLRRIAAALDTTVAELLGEPPVDARPYENLLAAIWLYIPWHQVTGHLTTKQRDLFADAVDACHARASADDPALAARPVERWWRDSPVPGTPQASTGSSGATVAREPPSPWPPSSPAAPVARPPGGAWSPPRWPRSC